MSLNTLERDDILRRIAWQNAEIDKIKRMLKGEQVGTARIADAAITNAKISDLTWDKAQGGTAKLGGLNNVDGILEINDAAGDEIGKWDKDGILINDGKLVIKNDSDVISIDSKGIISTANFTKSDASAGGLNQVISTGGVDTDITGCTLTFTLDRQATVLMLLTTSTYLTETLPATNTGHGKTDIYVDGVNKQNILFYSGSDVLTTRTCHYLSTLAAGSHTIKGVGRLIVTNGSPTLTIYDFRISYIIFGT